MVYSARLISVLIASPGDVASERKAIVKELEDWNRQHHPLPDKIRLVPTRWEVDAVPEVGRGDVQTVINHQLVDAADIVIVVFHARLGTPTPRAISGTAEELNRAAKAGKPVHVYFSQKPVAIDHDPAQLHSVREFRRNLQGYVADFATTKDLQRRVRDAITKDVEELKRRPGFLDHRSIPAQADASTLTKLETKLEEVRRERMQDWKDDLRDGIRRSPPRGPFQG